MQQPCTRYKIHTNAPTLSQIHPKHITWYVQHAPKMNTLVRMVNASPTIDNATAMLTVRMAMTNSIVNQLHQRTQPTPPKRSCTPRNPRSMVSRRNRKPFVGELAMLARKCRCLRQCQAQHELSAHDTDLKTKIHPNAFGNIQNNQRTSLRIQ